MAKSLDLFMSLTVLWTAGKPNSKLTRDTVLKQTTLHMNKLAGISIANWVLCRNHDACFCV
jgi:hypothetical protein